MTPPPPRTLIEAALWALPGLAALGLWRAAARGRRAGWFVVAGACGVIVLDKLADLQIRLYRLGKATVADLDPGTRLRGEHLWLRIALLAGLFLAGALALRLAARADRHRTRGKRVAFAGLLMVLAFLGVRLVPSLKDLLAHPRDLWVEGAAWLVVVAGVLLGRRERYPEPGRGGSSGG